MKSTNRKAKVVSYQFPEQFQFLARVYQEVDFVQLHFFIQDTDRDCESKVEIEIEVL